MEIAKITDGVIQVGQHRTLFPGTSFPESGPDEVFLAENGCLPVSHDVPHNPQTETLVPSDPYVLDSKVFVTQVVPKSQETLQAQVAAKVDALWRAADSYTSSYISGVAVGILTIGVLQQKPKAMAITAWSSAIWAEYYARKMLVTASSEDNHDFSSFGPMPYSVPELQEEVGL